MKNYLNTPDSIEEGFLSIEKRIKSIERAIGSDKISQLSHCIADFLFHMQEDESSFNSIINPKKKQAQVAICILNASVEMQSAYHLLTTGNIPGVFRQCRLLHEFVAVVIFVSLSKELLLENLSANKHRLIEKISQNPNSSFWELYTSEFKSMGENFQRIDPIIKGNLLIQPYIDFLRKCLNISQSEITLLSTQIKHVQHPSSHGSIELLPFHFGTASIDGKGGINYSPNKDEWYQDAMSYLHWTVTFLTNVLNLTRIYLQKNQEI